MALQQLEQGWGSLGAPEQHTRGEERVNVRIAIFEGASQKKIVLNYSVNLSSGGVFIETRDIRPVDTLLTLKFKLSGNDAVICCRAGVAWTNDPDHPKDADLPPGMGLRFVDLSLEELRALRSLLDRGGIRPTW